MCDFTERSNCKFNFSLFVLTKISNEQFVFYPCSIRKASSRPMAQNADNLIFKPDHDHDT